MLIRAPLLSDGPSGARGQGGVVEVPAAGPEAALPSPAITSPRPPPPWAAFFTTSGYRALHEFRSQWNYFRILVNREFGVFHKLSITAVWWAEPGLGASNGCREAWPPPTLPPLLGASALQADGLSSACSHRPQGAWAGVGSQERQPGPRIWGEHPGLGSDSISILV